MYLQIRSFSPGNQVNIEGFERMRVAKMAEVWLKI